MRLLHGTQLLEQLLVGESGHHEELILGKEVVNELLLHISCLVRTKKAEVRTCQDEESQAAVTSLSEAWGWLPAINHGPC